MTRNNWILIAAIGILIPIYSVYLPLYPLFMAAIVILSLLYFGFKKKWVYFSLLPVFLLVNILLIKNNIIHFTYLPQLRDLIHVNPLDLVLAGHIWGPRFIVTYPSILLSSGLNWDIDSSFTFYMMIMLLFIILLNAKIGMLFRGTYQYSSFIFGMSSLVIMGILSIVMNGRLVSAFLGILLVLYVQMVKVQDRSNYRLKDIFIFSLGFILSTVSSGTMMVSLIQILLVSFVILIMNGYPIKRLLLVMITFCIASGPYILKMIDKNLSYYGGGVKGLFLMLSHGLGQILLQNAKIVVLLAICIIPLAIMFWRIIKLLMRSQSVLLPVWCSLPICLTCGLFGLSTALMILPSLLIFISYILVQAWVSYREFKEETLKNHKVDAKIEINKGVSL